MTYKRPYEVTVFMYFALDYILSLIAVSDCDSVNYSETRDARILISSYGSGDNILDLQISKLLHLSFSVFLL